MKRIYNLLVGDIADIFREMVGELAPMGRLFFRFGVIFALLSAWMAWNFGIQVSVQHGIGLAAVALMVAFAPHAAHYLWSVKGEKGAAVAAIAGTAIFGVIELTTHLGYTSSSRAMNTGEARVQNMAFTDNRGSVTTYEGQVEAFKAKAKKLDEGLDKLTEKKVGDWKVSVRPASPTALDGAISAKKLEVANETKRGGCGPRCEARTNELAHLGELKAAATAIAENRAELGKAIEELAEAKKAAGATEFKHSAVANSTAFVGNIVRVISGSQEVSPMVQERAELVWTTLQSVGFALAAMFCLWLAGRFRLDRVVAHAFTPGASASHEPTSVPSIPRVATKAKSWFEDCYKPQCLTVGIAPVAT
jgi:hypothetical protein